MLKHKHVLMSATASVLFTFTACGDASTDTELPVGMAPNTATMPVRNDTAVNRPGDPDAYAAPSLIEIDKASAIASSLELLTQAKATSASAADDKPKRIEAGGMSSELPKGWTVGPKRQMRLLTLLPPKAQEGAEMAVAKWPGDVGGFKANVTRWARQVGIKSAGVERKDYPQIDVGGTKSAWILLMNKKDDKAILALWVPRGENPDKPTETWTVKLTGSAKQIEALAPAVLKWAGTVKFEEK